MTTPAHGKNRTTTPSGPRTSLPSSHRPTRPATASEHDSGLMPVAPPARLPEIPVMSDAAFEDSSVRPRIREDQATPAYGAISPLATEEDAIDLRWEMLQRYEEGDLVGSLHLAERLLDVTPASESARMTAERCRAGIVEMHLATLGGGDTSFRMVLPPATLKMLSLDHRAGFLLSFVDGYATIEEILDMAAMPRHEALTVLASLFRRGVIAR